MLKKTRTPPCVSTRYTEVVSKIKRAFYPDDLMAELRELRTEITQLRSVVDKKDSG